jgi:hypothetical protein
MDGRKLALHRHAALESFRKTSSCMPRSLGRYLLLMPIAFGVAGCADHFCDATYPRADRVCSSHTPMQPTYFPALL